MNARDLRGQRIPKRASSAAMTAPSASARLEHGPLDNYQVWAIAVDPTTRSHLVRRRVIPVPLPPQGYGCGPSAFFRTREQCWAHLGEDERALGRERAPTSASPGPRLCIGTIGSGIWRTEDGGQSWANIRDGIWNDIDPSSAAMTAPSAQAGAPWTSCGPSGTPATPTRLWRAAAPVLLPTRVDGVRRSLDGGDSWTAIGGAPPWARPTPARASGTPTSTTSW